jgi:hypothetical protein
MYEVEDKWKVGLFVYYYSKQTLSDGTVGKSYWITGFMAERLWEKFSSFVNFENFTDTRQIRFGSIYNETVTNPVFKDIYAPLDGFVINSGIKLFTIKSCGKDFLAAFFMLVLTTCQNGQELSIQWFQWCRAQPY